MLQYSRALARRLERIRKMAMCRFLKDKVTTPKTSHLILVIEAVANRK